MILVTGATGYVGKEDVIGLIKRNATFKVAPRSRETEGVYIDIENPSSVKAPLTAVTKLYLIRPPHLA
ncbi:SDR family NAD(P)-dependent oxidoreductase, partial [Bacillus wiedmannii]|nr:SDR family NAD(P)-dependent oxidoreductase [Bacillus wiedmannii]